MRRMRNMIWQDLVCLRVLDNIVASVRDKAGKVIVVVENNKPLLSTLQTGVYGVAVTPEDIREARKVVADEEGRIILGK